MITTHHSPSSRHGPPSRTNPAPGPWPGRAEPPSLRAGEIHLWYLPSAAPLPNPTSNLLPMDEWRRAGRRAPEARALWISIRLWLRLVLGTYAGCLAEAVRFRYGPRGKPALAGAGGPCFSLSHSASSALLGIAVAPLGVDLELLRPQRRKGPAALRAWARREAVLKATGEGLTPDGLTAREVGGLRVIEVQPAPACVGAVAIAAPEPAFRCWTWVLGPAGDR